MKNKYNILIITFGIAKLLIHFLTNTNYGLHRDEFLYFDEGKNLGWGFIEVPPLTPFIGQLADLLGGSVFAIRLFPALVGALIVILSGLLVRELGGKKWAVIFTCSALILSPALLWTNTLFQPVSFNQFFWFLTAYLLIRIIKQADDKWWYWLGVTIGLGILTKYSIGFYVLGLAVAILLSPHRKVFATRYPYIALGIAILISLPNLLWQMNHGLPVVVHMRALSQSQLIHVSWDHFLQAQLTFHFASSAVWIAGLIGLFAIRGLKPFRFVGVAWFITVLMIGALSGKAYYTAGAYLILFAFGGITLEKAIAKTWVRAGALALFAIITLGFVPYSLPLLKIERMKRYCTFMKDRLGLISELRWEDGQYYTLPQDMADMNGWEEMAQKVAELYHSLTPEQKENCFIYGGGYAHASSLNFFAKKYDLPRVHSLNGSYLIWAPTEIQFESQIMIDDTRQTTSAWFNQMTLIDSIQDPYAREKGYIYFRDSPKIDVEAAWKNNALERKREFNFD